ncbi:MAG: DUF6869 domain-containing protein [Pseudomonadota bacterium]
MSLPACMDCDLDGLGFPCRTDGRLDPAKVAEAALRHYRATFGATGEFGDSPDRWAGSCWSETLTQEAPDACLDACIALLELKPTNAEIPYFAAGPLEDLVTQNGPAVIDRIEAEAKVNPQFRYLLSGIWGQSRTDPDVWRRIQAAIEAGPHMDDDPRTPQGSTRPLK